MVLFAKVVHSTLALLPFFVFIEKRLGQHWVISVLDTLEAFQAEGNALHHCVFQCEYYAKADSLILSAHDKEGNRIETIEFSLTEGKVIQSRGLCNTNTPHHDRIVRLVNAHAHQILAAKQTA